MASSSEDFVKHRCDGEKEKYSFYITMEGLPFCISDDGLAVWSGDSKPAVLKPHAPLFLKSIQWPGDNKQVSIITNEQFCRAKEAVGSNRVRCIFGSHKRTGVKRRKMSKSADLKLEQFIHECSQRTSEDAGPPAKRRKKVSPAPKMDDSGSLGSATKCLGQSAPGRPPADFSDSDVEAKIEPKEEAKTEVKEEAKTEVKEEAKEEVKEDDRPVSPLSPKSLAQKQQAKVLEAVQSNQSTSNRSHSQNDSDNRDLHENNVVSVSNLIVFASWYQRICLQE